MTTTTIPKVGATVWSSDDTSRIAHVADDPFEHMVLDEGEFVIESFHGFKTIARLTGRTRKFFGGLSCPTIERFEIETVVIDESIRGVKGAQMVGTFAVRPEMMS